MKSKCILEHSVPLGRQLCTVWEPSLVTLIYGIAVIPRVNMQSEIYPFNHGDTCIAWGVLSLNVNSIFWMYDSNTDICNKKENNKARYSILIICRCVIFSFYMIKTCRKQNNRNDLISLMVGQWLYNVPVILPERIQPKYFKRKRFLKQCFESPICKIHVRIFIKDLRVYFLRYIMSKYLWKS